MSVLSVEPFLTGAAIESPGGRGSQRAQGPSPLEEKAIDAEKNEKLKEALQGLDQYLYGW